LSRLAGEEILGGSLLRRKTTGSRRTAKKKRSFRLRFLLVTLLLIFLSCVYVWQRVTMITLSTRAKELRLETKRMQETRKYLEVEVADLSSVSRIEEKGLEMGLTYPRLDQIGLIRELHDSAFLERRGFAKNVWAKLTTLRESFLSGDEAVAREIENEP
jgi:cell division protein FtsL